MFCFIPVGNAMTGGGFSVALFLLLLTSIATWCFPVHVRVIPLLVFPVFILFKGPPQQIFDRQGRHSAQ